MEIPNLQSIVVKHLLEETLVEVEEIKDSLVEGEVQEEETPIFLA